MVWAGRWGVVHGSQKGDRQPTSAVKTKQVLDVFVVWAGRWGVVHGSQKGDRQPTSAAVVDVQVSLARVLVGGVVFVHRFRSSLLKPLGGLVSFVS